MDRTRTKSISNTERRSQWQNCHHLLRSEKNTEIITDASPVGISGIVLQENKDVSHASKALTDVETRYLQTENETWTFEYFHIYRYLFGHRFTHITEAEALENIYENPTSRPPERLKI